MKPFATVGIEAQTVAVVVAAAAVAAAVVADNDCDDDGLVEIAALFDLPVGLLGVLLVAAASGGDDAGDGEGEIVVDDAVAPGYLAAVVGCPRVVDDVVAVGNGGGVVMKMRMTLVGGDAAGAGVGVESVEGVDCVEIVDCLGVEGAGCVGVDVVEPVAEIAGNAGAAGTDACAGAQDEILGVGVEHANCVEAKAAALWIRVAVAGTNACAGELANW
mmetsp:Transcript_42713/g.83744  ORF Transcript_42713/g.83744 Transcript_42713/m.83744 type:complete len:217 (+) Transcript_42713:343-993(+)